MERLKISISYCFLFFIFIIAIKHPNIQPCTYSIAMIAKPLPISPIYYTDISFTGQGPYHLVSSAESLIRIIKWEFILCQALG